MASSTNPPEEQRKVIDFNPLVLDRTVIAVPLLKKMQEDFELIAVVKKFHPKEVWNSTPRSNSIRNFPGGATPRVKWTEEALPKVAEEAIASYASRVGGTEEKSEEQRIEKARSLLSRRLSPNRNWDRWSSRGR